LTARPIWILDHAEIAGGGQRFALRVARYAAEDAGTSVRMACPADSELAGWCAESGVAVHDASFPPFRPSKAWQVATALPRTRALLRGAPADALIVANSARVQAYLFAASRVGGRRRSIVNVMHEQDSARRASARLAYRRFGSLLVIGEGAAAAYRERLPGVPVLHANNFLLPEELGRFERLRTRPPSAGAPLALAAIGRLIPEKGLLELVEELAGARVRPLWRSLTVAAFSQDAGYEARLRRRIEELGLGAVVVLTGPRPALDVLAEADALVVPSVGHEGQPTVIVEALAAGVPVILRSPLWSAAYAGLPVSSYASPDELAAVLERPPDGPASSELVAERFGPHQFLSALEAASR
jgi:glycosyltransferase involved in cell wall biosynthesis